MYEISFKVTKLTHPKMGAERPQRGRRITPKIRIIPPPSLLFRIAYYDFYDDFVLIYDDWWSFGEGWEGKTGTFNVHFGICKGGGKVRG